MPTAVSAARETAPLSPSAFFAHPRFSLHIPASAATLTGFRAWAKSDELPEKLRVAFIQGEIYLEMSNEELETHVVVKDELIRVLKTLNRELKLGRFYGDGVLVTNEVADV